MVDIQVLKQNRVEVYHKKTNSLENALIRIKENILFMSTQDCVCKLECVDCGAFYIEELSR